MHPYSMAWQDMMKNQKNVSYIHGMAMRIPYLEWRGDLDFDPTLRGKA